MPMEVNALPPIARGSLRIWYCYDIGDDLKLETAARRFDASHSQSRPQFQPRQHQPEFFGFRPRPLRLLKSTGEFQIGEYRTNRMAELTVWGGARLSVEYRFELPKGTTIDAVTEICAKLEQEPVLELDARQQAELLVNGDLREALENARVSSACEDYVVLVVDEFESPVTPDELRTAHGAQLATFLRQQGKGVKLSDQFVDDTLVHRFSWSDDLTVVDWNAAFLFGDGLEDVLELLEFVQVQLLGLRFLNSSLDGQLDDAYTLFETALKELKEKERARYKWLRWIWQLGVATAKQVGLLSEGKETIESTINKIRMAAVEARKASGAIRDAINLIGDPTLYRIHELAAQRFGFERLTENIEKQIAELDAIYQKLHDQKSESRGVFLELVVIILILIEVIHSFIH